MRRTVLLLTLLLSACASADMTHRDWAQCSTDAERAMAQVQGERGLYLLDGNIRHCMEGRGYSWRMDNSDCKALEENPFATVDSRCFRRGGSNSN